MGKISDESRILTTLYMAQNPLFQLSKTTPFGRSTISGP